MKRREPVGRYLTCPALYKGPKTYL